jgi:hypothetical protein
MREDYETSDLWQTAFMICKGARLRKMTMDKIKPGRIYRFQRKNEDEGGGR